MMRNIGHLVWILALGLAACKGQQGASEPKTSVDKTETVKPTNEADVNAQVATPPSGLETTIEAKTKEWPADVIAGMEKNPCFGTCPVYEFRLHRDLTATLEAKQFTDITGSFSTSISRTQKDELFSLMNDAGYFDFEENYDGPVTDLPSTFLYFSPTGKSHGVHARFETPEELREFIAAYEEWIFNLNWK